MTIKRILLFIALFWLSGAQASIVQESDTIKKTRKVLDAFLLGEDLEWSVRLVSNFKQQQFRLSNDDSKLIYRPNNPFGVGFGIANQNMVIDVLFNIKAGTEDVTEKFAAEGALVINRNMLGFAIENVHGYQVTSKQTDLQEFRDDISVFSLGLEYIRILSKDNITVRGMKRGIEDQKKSIFSYGLGGFAIIKDLKADGMFVEKALTPNTNMVKGLVELDEQDRVVIDCGCRTNVPGLFAAGDVTNNYQEQVLIAVGEGAKAALSAYEHLLPQL